MDGAWMDAITGWQQRTIELEKAVAVLQSQVAALARLQQGLAEVESIAVEASNQVDRLQRRINDARN